MSERDTEVSDVMQRLRAAVAARRESGEYPPGLEDDLDRHFQRIIVSRTQLPRLALLRRRIEAARRAARFTPERIPISSRLPGGTALHRTLSRIFLRQAVGILSQIQEFATRALDALDAAAAVAESPDNHRHDDMIEILDAHTELLAAAAGTTGTAGIAGSPDYDVIGRLECLEATDASRRWRPWFGRARFDAAFDDGQRHRLEQASAGALGDCAPILNLVPSGDAPLAVLAATADASLGGIAVVRAEDMMAARDVVDLIGLAFVKLVAGGRLVISCGLGETPRFDPTLGPPLPAAYAAFVCREAGFAAVDIETWPAAYQIVATR